MDNGTQGNQEPNLQIQPKLVIILTLDPMNGELTVKGPTDQPILFLGMLEMAKQALTNVKTVDRSSKLFTFGR